MNDPAKLQAAKNDFAASQSITPCTNARCGFAQCTCGDKCGCHVPKEDLKDHQTHCDPCAEFKLQKKREKESMEGK